MHLIDLPSAVIEAIALSAGVVLSASGIAKVLRPTPFAQAVQALWRARLSDATTRSIAAVEAVTGLSIVVAHFVHSLHWVRLLGACAYFIFAAVVMTAIRHELSSCGCFGSAQRLPRLRHGAFNLCAALALALSAFREPDPHDTPLTLALALGVTAFAGWVLIARPVTTGLRGESREALVFLGRRCQRCELLRQELGRADAISQLQVDRIAFAPPGAKEWTSFDVTTTPRTVLLVDGQRVGESSSINLAAIASELEAAPYSDDG